MTYITFQSVRDRLATRAPREVRITPDLREAAVAVVLAPATDGGLRALFIQRAEHPGDPWSGQMGFPGGRRDPDDTDLLATALRETREELNLDLRQAELLGQLDDLSPVSFRLPQVVVRPYVFGLEEVPPLTHSAEVAAHVWADLRALHGARTTETVLVRGHPRDFPGYRVGPYFIWGMTERVLTPFLQLLLGDDAEPGG